MVNEVGEHGVISRSSQNLGVLLTSQLGNTLLITGQDAEEHLRVDLLVGVIQMIEATVLSPITVSRLARIREDLSRVGVVSVVQNGGVGHENDVLRLDSGSHKISVHTARVLRLTVIANTLR